MRTVESEASSEAAPQRTQKASAERQKNRKKSGNHPKMRAAPVFFETGYVSKSGFRVLLSTPKMIRKKKRLRSCSATDLRVVIRIPGVRTHAALLIFR